MQQRVKREKIAHKENDVLAESYRLKNKFSHIWCYPSRKRVEDTLIGHLKRINGEKVLDYGCGRGELSRYLLDQGANVHGIDITSMYIKEAKDHCNLGGYDTDKFRFYVMDAHEMDFPNNFFDLVVGLGILHHLELNVALLEIHRVLKPGGRVLLQEPLADNLLLKLFRRLTPSARTKDEKPLTGYDINLLKESEYWISDLRFCGLLEAPIAMITSIIAPKFPDNVLLRASDWVERKLQRAEILYSWNQYVLINMIKRS